MTQSFDLMNRYRGLLAVLAITSLAGRAIALDTVKTKTGVSVSGELTRYDERGITLQLANGKSVSYDADQIESVKAKLNDHHELADKALARKDYAQAATEYERAVEEEQRAWALSRIRSGLVTALRGSDQIDKAGQIFLEIAGKREDPEVMLLAPLIWLPGQKASDAAQAVARRWLSDPKDPMASLLASSWLLETPDAAKAVAVLERLQTINDPRIGWLARAQWWRVHAARATKDEVDRYRDLMSRIPPAIQAGPRYTLGLAYAKVGDPKEAALAFLWIPFVSEGKSELAADSLLRGAQATDEAGFRDEAQTLYQEVVKSYPNSTWAEAAKQRLESLGGKKN